MKLKTALTLLLVIVTMAVQAQIINLGNPESFEPLLKQNFAGKTVYIDVMASWCKPCLTELPASKELDEYFNEYNIVRLFVTIDNPEDIDNCIELLNKYNLSGYLVTYHQQGKRPQNKFAKEVETLFMRDKEGKFVVSIPKYAIADKKGSIVIKKAERPSNPNALKRQIQELISAQAQKNEPLILQGQITNSPEKELYLLSDSLGKLKLDTLQLNNEGHFYLKTYNVMFPQKVSIRNKRTQINDFYVAPGYNLTITADATDFPTLITTTKITGKGAESNSYRELFLKEYITRKDSANWYEITDEAKFLNYLKAEKQLNDSLEQVAFGKTVSNDPYFSYFAEMTRLDNLFIQEYKKMAFPKITGMNAAQTREFVEKYTDATLLKELNNETYFISDNYKLWYVNEYLDYLLKLDYDKDSTLRANNFYNIEKINETLQGKIREYTLFNKLLGKIHYASENFQQLNENREKAHPYVASLENEYYKQAVENAFAEKEKLLYATQKGQPAPVFTLKSNKDKEYSLSDFNGKVIYIDLWASWCAPCRAEIPALKKIYDTYKNDDRIEIIGIAVHDGKKEWLNAIKTDSPQWLQLYDENGNVQRSYNAVAIPKYVLIDKKGNIAGFNAPRPSDSEKLISEINKLLEE